jgi:hypothetical protein
MLGFSEFLDSPRPNFCKEIFLVFFLQFMIIGVLGSNQARFEIVRFLIKSMKLDF